jgi:hypothetical protein
MLKRDRFSGSRNDPSVASRFWKDFGNEIAGLSLESHGNLATIGKERAITFYDTPDRYLQARSYIFRERVDIKTNAREVTLKFRHPDRFIAEDRDIAAAYVGTAKTKFEEDIKLPFVQFYSLSTTQRMSASRHLSTLKNINKLHPGLRRQLKPFDGNKAIEAVQGFIAEEVVITGANVQIGCRRNIIAECAMIVWREREKRKGKPVVVEFSFRYRNRHGRYEAEAAQQAYDVFGILRRDMGEWVDSDGQTKTGYVFSLG